MSPNQNNIDAIRVRPADQPEPQSQQSVSLQENNEPVQPKQKKVERAKTITPKKTNVKRLPRGSVSRESKEYFVENLSMLIASGVTIGEALVTVASEMPSKRVKKAVLDMAAKVDEGSMFWKSLEESGILNISAVALIKAGEESGRLAENLKVVAEQIHKNNVRTAKVRSALLYPAFLLTLLILVGSGIGLFLLPKLAEIFNGLDVQLNLLTKLLINFGIFWSHWGLILTGVMFVLLFFMVLAITYNKTIRSWAEVVLFKLPGMGRLMYETEISRFGFILGSLLDAGLPAVEALDSLSDSMATKRYRDATKIMRDSIEEGNTFATTFDRIKDRKAFPGPIRQLIISAEKSGNLSETLLKLSKIYEDKADITSRNLETLLEPVILVIIAIGVLFVALAVVLPIYSLVGGIDTGGTN